MYFGMHLSCEGSNVVCVTRHSQVPTALILAVSSKFQVRFVSIENTRILKYSKSQQCQRFSKCLKRFDLHSTHARAWNTDWISRKSFGFSICPSPNKQYLVPLQRSKSCLFDRHNNIIIYILQHLPCIYNIYYQ